MTIKQLQNELAELKAKQTVMEAQLLELCPPTDEVTDADLFYILHHRGFQAYRAALKERNTLYERRVQAKR